MNDLISRQGAIDTVDSKVVSTNPEHFKSSEKFIKFMDDADIASFGKWQWANGFNTAVVAAKIQLEKLPSAETESCEYYALCRHGRDENKLRARLGFCEYCNKDTDGFVTPIEKNGHAFVRFGMNGWELSLKAKGWHGSAKIRYCPMCGRDLLVK